MNTRAAFDRLILTAGAVCFLAGSLAWAQEYSHARIVRLSFVEGTVTVARPASTEWTEASVNTPLEEGFKLATAQDSFAEVEFENTSTARIGQLSELHFNQLALAADGGKLNHLELRQGYGTFDFIPEDGDDYQVTAGTATLTLGKDKTTRFRVDLQGDNVRVEVFKGAVEIASPFGTEQIAKNQVFEMRPGADRASITHGITKDAWDEWVDERESQAQVARHRSPPGLYTNDVSSLLYGWNDLYYYGSWAYLPGYGYGWTPNVSAGWSPYTYGQWAWYPGFGYTWISYEPWGWAPFHYGGWIYQPGLGWCWIPSGFNAWSPGVVSWYQGPGWVGWAPRAPRPWGTNASARSTPTSCPRGQDCTTAVTEDAFREGLPVRGHRIPMVDIPRTYAVDSPSVRPSELGSVSGSRLANGVAGGVPARSQAVQAGQSGAAARTAAPASGRTRSTSAPGGSFAARSGATQGAVVYDPAEGRFVNGHNAAPAPRTAGSTETAPDVNASVGSAAAARTQPVSSARATEAGHHASPRSGVDLQRPSGASGRLPASWGVGRTAPRSSGMGASHREPSPMGNSGSWSVGSSSTGSSGGARSSGGGGSFGTAGARSGGGVSSGGGRSSSNNSGHPH